MGTQRVWYDWATFTFTHIYKDIHALIPHASDSATSHGKRHCDFDDSAGSWIGRSILDYTGMRKAMGWLMVEASNAGCENEGRSPQASLQAGKDKSRKTSLLLYLVLSHVQLFCDPLGWNHPGSSVHGSLQARILEWVAMPSSRRCSQPRVRTCVSRLAGKFFAIWITREIQNLA